MRFAGRVVVLVTIALIGWTSFVDNREVVIPDEKVKADVPLDKAVTVTFTPKRTGEIRYSCALVGGVLEVR